VTPSFTHHNEHTFHLVEAASHNATNTGHRVFII
jgi:hypothetical protein